MLNEPSRAAGRSRKVPIPSAAEIRAPVPAPTPPPPRVAPSHAAVRPSQPAPAPPADEPTRSAPVPEFTPPTIVIREGEPGALPLPVLLTGMAVVAVLGWWGIHALRGGGGSIRDGRSSEVQHFAQQPAFADVADEVTPDALDTGEESDEEKRLRRLDELRRELGLPPLDEPRQPSIFDVPQPASDAERIDPDTQERLQRLYDLREELGLERDTPR